MKMKRNGLWVLFALLVLFVSGCGQRERPVLPAFKQEAQRNAIVVLGGLQEPDTLNPLLSDLASTHDVGRLLFSGLLVQDEQGRSQPDLASVVPTVQNGGISRDGLTVTYRLRNNVTWHDGVPFTAEDVRFTWQLISQGKVHPYWREMYSRVATVEAPDKYTVIVRFREYDPRQLELFHVILPQHRLGGSRDLAKDAFQRQPVGTGPFRLKEWRMAEALHFAANDRYFRGRPKLEGIQYRVIPEAALLVSLLKNGEVDLVGNIALQSIDQVRGAENMQLVLSPSAIWEHVDLNTENPLFADVRVRKALSLALDRQAVVNAGVRGVGFPAIAGISPASWLANPEIKAPVRDLAAAKELLEQAGWRPGPSGWLMKEGKQLAFVLHIPAKDSLRENVASQLVQQWRDIGVKAEVRPVEIKLLQEEILRSRRYEAALYGWVTELNPWWYNHWHSKRIPGPMNGYGGFNFTAFRNPELDSLLERTVFPQEEEQNRMVAYRVQEILRDEAPAISLYFRAQADVLKPRLRNFKPNPTIGGNCWNAWEWDVDSGK